MKGDTVDAKLDFEVQVHKINHDTESKSEI